MTAAKVKTEPRKPTTTTGACILCGSGSCESWRTAALTEEKHVDHGALLKAHGITPAEVVHSDAGEIVIGEDGKHPGAAPLAPMVLKPTKSFQKNRGRVGPLPVKVRR